MNRRAGRGSLGEDGPVTTRRPANRPANTGCALQAATGADPEFLRGTNVDRVSRESG